MKKFKRWRYNSNNQGLHCSFICGTLCQLYEPLCQFLFLYYTEKHGEDTENHKDLYNSLIIIQINNVLHLLQLCILNRQPLQPACNEDPEHHLQRIRQVHWFLKFQE
jgi:hypothetical protein